MTEFLLSKENPSENNQKIPMITNVQNDEMDTSLRDHLFEFDMISETLKHIYSKSKIRKSLSKSLAIFYTYPMLIIVISFLIGLLLFCLPFLLLYFKIFDNIMIPIIIILFITLLFSIFIIIIRVIDDLRNRINIGAKWERQNIIKNIELSLTVIILIISAFLFSYFFKTLMEYKNNGDIKFVYDVYNNSEDFKYDYILKQIIEYFILEENQIKNKSEKINYYLNESKLSYLHLKLLISFIPLLVLCIAKLIQIILIQVKFTFPKTIVFISFFILIILIMVSHFYYDKKDYNWRTISILDIISLGFIYIGYIFWGVNSAYKLNKDPKDKNFAIYKYDLCQLLIIMAFDLINIFGSSFIFLSFIINYINYAYNNMEYNDLINIFRCLKTGFLLCNISYSYYFGHYLLSLIFRPIALNYAPAKLKKFCKKANKNISSFINIKRIN